VSSAKPAERNAELIVDISDRAVVDAPRGADLSRRHRVGVHRANVAQAARMRIKPIRRDWVPVSQCPARSRGPSGVARLFIEEGFLWNSGNFIFRADVMLE
jgi:hypothetical protein